MKNIANTIVGVTIILFSINSFGQNLNLSDTELNDMKYMVEEEKVARDVYDFLGAKWNLQIFKNIKESEQRHMEMMQSLLENNKVAYEISNEKGIFINSELQKMYQDLTLQGSKSLREALQVGKFIEETDINDLERAIKNTKDTYLKQVYSNLLQASQNHLRAFNRQLSKY